MGKYKHKIALVIATKDRPEELYSLLNNLESQTYEPDEVIIVDGGEKPLPNLLFNSRNFRIKYIRFLPPSAARQRNAGLKTIDSGIDLVGFLDDDTVLQSLALERMMAFYDKVPLDIVGAGFNLINHPPLSAPKLKSLPIVEKMGLYSPNRGRVLCSGFQTMIGTVDKDTNVQWLPTGAAVWRRSILDAYQFDEWFAAYSYLEDLEFSYRAAKNHRLVIVADAGYFHYPASGGRERSYLFGKREVANRLYFVKKHPELSVRSCAFSLILRMLLTFFLFFKKGDIRYLRRILGNIAGFKQAFLNDKLFVKYHKREN